jgi:hypothetical protein
MGRENDNDSPAGNLSESEQELFDEVTSFVNESIQKINDSHEENVNLLMVQMTEKMQKAVEEQKSDDELRLIQDEYVRQFTSTTINANKEALEMVGEVEGVDGLEDYPKASWIIAHKQDEGGWFANWLPHNPGFFENVMGGEWPDWLPPPPPGWRELS